MQFRPRLDHALLALGQAAGNQLDGINSLNRCFVLIVGVKMRRVVLDACLHVHANDDSEKPAQLRHDLKTNRLDTRFQLS